MSMKYLLKSLFVLCSSSLLVADALDLQPVKQHEFAGTKRRLGKRDTSVLDLRSYETLLWEAPDGPDLILGNFTVHTPGDTENVLAMDHFDDMITSVVCNPDSLILTFDSDETFAYAQKVWDWVNGADDHSFIMVTSAGDCGPNTLRTPYLVSKLEYDEGANVAHLVAKAEKWEDIVHMYELHVGKVPVPEARRKLKARDEKDDSTVFSVAKPFPFTVKVETGPLMGQLECSDCGLGGQLAIDMHINYGFPEIVDQAILKIQPQGIRATAHPKLTLGAQYKKPHVWKESLFPTPIPLYAITLGGVMKLGVFNDVKGGIELTAFEGQIELTAGADVTIPDSAFVEVDLTEPSKMKSSSWTPQVDIARPQLSGKAAAGFQLFVMPEITLEASALKFGYEAALELKAPYWEVKAELEADPTGGVCDKETTTLGLGVTSSFGVELMFEAGEVKSTKKPVEISIATLPLKELSPFCISLENNNGKKPAKSSTTKPGASKPTDADTPAGTPTCTANSGEKGNCIATSACKDLGGYSEAGHCPGASNIQCCTYSKGSGDSCTANGISGTCMPTSSCPGSTGVSVPGHCEGAADIQCCVAKEKESSEKTDGLCTIDKAGLKNSGFIGECISTSACKSGGGTSTAGFCPGSADVQCCTYGTCANDVAGTCEPKSSCTGKTTAGLCGGGKDIMCCQQEFVSGHPGQQ